MATAPERQPGSSHAVLAGFLGWTLDAFDFFVIVFLYDVLAKQFGVTKSEIIYTTTATLAMRPLGAVLFGMLADRYGRRVPLIANVIFFSVVELLSGFAPNYTVFLILRALYGIGMGGEWGVGASLAMEMAPQKWRGVLSGILQSGYSIGYLLAAVAARWYLPLFSPEIGWRAMFWLGGAPALLALYVRTRVPESTAWKQHRARSLDEIWNEVRKFAAPLAYLFVMMTLFMFLSHGTQDLYPDFLKSVHGATQGQAALVAILYNIGAVVGAILFGHLSQKIGRRYAMVAALALCLAVIPFWAFGASLFALAAAATLLQVGVQGAWGVVPAHLNELAPDRARGLIPGLAYQMGILFAAPVNSIEYRLRDRMGYQWTLAGFEIANIILLAVVVLLGRERHGRSFVAEE